MATNTNGAFYRELTRHVRRVIVEEICDREYRHLKNPNNRSCSLRSDEIRLGVLFRPSSLPLTGKRNLEIGRNELLLILQGVVPKADDWKNGVVFDCKRAPYRFVFGEKVAFKDFGYSLLQEFNHFFGWGKILLSRGGYAVFVRQVLGMTDTNLAVFRNIIGDGFYDPPQASLSMRHNCRHKDRRF